jgi:hypothetical protein
MPWMGVKVTSFPERWNYIDKEQLSGGQSHKLSTKKANLPYDNIFKLKI